MAKRSFPVFRVTIILEAAGELHSYVLTGESKSQFTGFADLEDSTRVKLIEAHVTRVQDPEPPKPRSRKQRR